MTKSPSCSQCAELHAQLAEKERMITQLHALMAELGQHDPMTGALNRRTLMDMLQTELQRAQRTGHPFCFAVIELDRFPDARHRYGHQASDAAVKKAAETAVKLLRTIDRFGRLDEQTFGIILPATWLDQGMIAMGRLARVLAACDLGEVTPGFSLTFSAGLTTNAFGDTAESMTRRADQAMQKARSDGGDRSVQAEEPLPAASCAD